MPRKPPTFRPPGAETAKRARDRERAKENVGRRKVYDRRRWRRLTRSYLSKNPLCEWPECRVPASVVGHVVPIVEGGVLWSSDNLQALCAHHHGVKTANEVNARKRKLSPPRRSARPEPGAKTGVILPSWAIQ